MRRKAREGRVAAACFLVSARYRFATFSVLEALLVFLQLFGARIGNYGGCGASLSPLEENLVRGICAVVCNAVLVFDLVAIDHGLAFGKKKCG